MKSIIKIEKPEYIKGTRGAREDWAKITGKPLMLKPAVFLHTETGEYFCNIVGGISYPIAVNDEIKPGMVIILGIQNEPTLKFKVLETFESDNVFTLIEQAKEAREKYGFKLDSRILPYWYGDQEKYQTIIIKVSEALEQKDGADRGFYIKDLVDLREKFSFPLYVRQIFNTLTTKTFDINGDAMLTEHLQGFRRSAAEKGKTENFPAVGLLGGMVHSLQIEKPWLEDVDGRGTVFNIDI